MTSKRKNIVWLASYPKSGNTWIRVLLSNLFSQSEKAADINDLIDAPIASNRNVFDEHTGVSSSELYVDEINCLRPQVYRKISQESDSDIFIKVHDAWQHNNNHEPIFPTDVTKGVLYIIRNPYDVAISYSHHFSISIQDAVAELNDSGNKICVSQNKLYSQLQQNLLSWSEHLITWLDHSKLPIIIIRYEDLHSNALNTLKNAFEQLNIQYTEERLIDSIKKSEFSELYKQEGVYGFNERPFKADRFFRNGKVTDNSTVIGSNIYKKILSKNEIVMSRFGYC